MSSSVNEQKPCPYCGNYHAGFCPKVKQIDYYPNGTIKSVILKP